MFYSTKQGARKIVMATLVDGQKDEKRQQRDYYEVVVASVGGEGEGEVFGGGWRMLRRGSCSLLCAAVIRSSSTICVARWCRFEIGKTDAMSR